MPIYIIFVDDCSKWRQWCVFLSIEHYLRQQEQQKKEQSEDLNFLTFYLFFERQQNSEIYEFSKERHIAGT